VKNPAGCHTERRKTKREKRVIFYECERRDGVSFNDSVHGLLFVFMFHDRITRNDVAT
jgi:hypothetical protein